MEEEFSIGYWIKRRRKAMDMTQKDLAGRVGCALITIAKIEADERKPSREIAELLAENLNIPVEQRPTFIQVMRGLKRPSHLRKIAATDFQSPQQEAVQPVIASPEADKFRGMELIGKISRSKLVARGGELVLVRSLWNLARGGESHALILQGEPGIGKSRLARELIQEIRPTGARVLIGECFSEGGMPYAPIIRILQSENLLPAELPQAVLADLAQVAPQLAIYAADIPANPPLDPYAEQQRLFESIHTYFRHFYEQKPILILIEDVHWADHGSIALLQSLMHRFRQMSAPVLMILTTRELSSSASRALNNLFDDLMRAHLSTMIHLERFDQNGTRDLLAAIFAQDITDEFIQLIQHETQGNPFFIEEVCKDLLESRQIYWDKGRWERKNLTDLRVPQNVRTAIQARLDKLGKETYELLQIGSAIGHRFEYEILRSIVPVNEQELIEKLEAAREAQIVQEVPRSAIPGEFEFTHALIASVLREGMSSPRRRNIHRQIVEALEKIHPNDFSLLAYHAREAAENDLAAAYLHKAGDQAMRTFAHEDAIRFYMEALHFAPAQSTEACQILLARARVYDLRAERPLQLADLQAAEAKASALQDPSIRAAVALAQAEYAIQVTEQADVIEHAKRAIELSEPAGLSPITAQAYMLWGRALSETGELAEAREKLLNAGKIAHEAGLDLIEVRSRINLGNVDYRLGEYAAAREKYLGSLGILRRLGERRIECMVINNLGNICWTEGDLDAAIRSYQDALEIARAIGDRLNEARALSNIGSILTEQYQYAYALQMLEQALPILREIGQQVDESVVLGHLADVMESLGRYDEAYEYRTEARALAHEADDPQSEAEHLTGLSRIETFRGNFESAENLAREAITISQQHDYDVEQAGAWQALAVSKIASEKLTDAEDAYANALELFEKLNQSHKVLEVHAELAWLAQERGDDASAQKHVQAVFPERDPSTWIAIHQPSVYWCCYEVLKQKDAGTAELLLQNGRSVLQQIAKQITDRKARQHYLKKLPHHAALHDAEESRNK